MNKALPTANRRQRPNLLTRPPSGVGDWSSGRLVIDPVAQLTELAELLRRGLLSREEYESIKVRVVGEQS
jgi:hypothetical protein